MNAQKQRLEVEPASPDDDDLAIENAARGESRGERGDELGKVSVHRLLVAALEQDLLPVAKNQRPKSVPLRLELPALTSRQRVRRAGQHRREGRSKRQDHGVILDVILKVCSNRRRPGVGPPPSSARSGPAVQVQTGPSL